LSVVITKEFGDISKLCCNDVEVVMKLVYLSHGRGKFITVNSVGVIVIDE